MRFASCLAMTCLATCRRSRHYPRKARHCEERGTSDEAISPKMPLLTELGWCAVRFTGANAPVYKYPNPKGLKRYHLYYPSFYFVQWKLSDTRNDVPFRVISRNEAIRPLFYVFNFSSLNNCQIFRSMRTIRLVEDF